VKSPSSERILRSRMLPQLSFRLLLGLTAGVAFLSMLGRFAGDGGAIARSVLFTLGVLFAVMMLGAVLFLFSWVVATFALVADEPASRQSPFADGQLPPQALPPRDRLT
jgi:hypothetical protein